MNFTTFPVASTNIFPQSNSKTGGQLLTEWNLRSRDMVSTSSSIKYEVGPSFVHSAHDFEVRIQQDNAGSIISTAALEIMPGRGVINGHYIETKTPMVIDMLEANATLQSQQRAPLKGELEVGIRIFYSTEPTMAGAMLVDNEDEMYEGVQLVILPKGELILPIDSPTDRSKVTAHIRLASFNYINRTITSIVNHDVNKCKYLSADRIDNIDLMLSDMYIKKSGLNAKRLYAFAGKGTDPATGADTWCDTTDSLMVWDNSPQRTTERPTATQATFSTSIDGKTVLNLPHKQVDGMVTANGEPEYYASRMIPLPVADYNANTSGTVDKTYTSHIKEISEKISQFHQIVKGKQILFLPTKNGDTVLPAINSAWNVGDYILVGEDYTAAILADGVRSPSTLYVVLPGLVSSILYNSSVTDSEVIPSGITGVELGSITWDANQGHSAPSTSADPTTYPVFFTPDDKIRGTKDEDYFVLTYINGETYTKYYYTVNATGDREYSPYILLTGEIPLATDTTIGGFYNVSSDNVDGGYVYRDEYGRLRLVDYALLRSGTLAYQLGEDITLPTDLTTEEIQSYLNEYVNQRIAFPNVNQLNSSINPTVINVYITLSPEDSPTTLNIGDIDSRFNTAVQFHISGTANSNTTINILDCEKIRIDNNIGGNPIINVYRSCIYYDPYVIDYVRGCTRPDGFKGFQDMKLWYTVYEESDPNLLVDNMTVSELDAPIISESIDFWNTQSINDNHYACALNSITFSSSGEIVKCSVLISNQSTNNIESGHKLVVSQFELPQGSGLIYPKSAMTKQLKVTGTFVSAYFSDTWIVTDTNFTLLTSTYDPYDLSPIVTGSIALHSDTNLIQADVGQVIPAWEPDTYHIFQGGAVS